MSRNIRKGCPRRFGRPDSDRIAVRSWSECSALGGKVRLLPGFQRLGVGLVTVWFVFWTVTSVMRPHGSENAAYLSPSLTEFAVLAPLLIAAAIFGTRWIVWGFRP